mmetsp:Transcript_7240/g.8361  ORF Transcript_7240/g.8361 Transcript_7240/m.8361 type:complete len:94 (+) Transcript_7240:261-542(+)
MCEELGDEELMAAYVEEYGNTSTCSIVDGKGCDEREVAYIESMKAKTIDDHKAQFDRLTGMEGNSMKADLLVWLKKRKKILRQFIAANGADEL